MKITWGLAALALVLGACRDGPLVPTGDPAPLTVMTWNVYVGTNVDNVIAASDPDDIPFLVADAFQTLLDTDFGERAEAFVNEIERRRPHLVGLQEISTIRRQTPSDLVLGGTQLPEDVLFDYLEILMDALTARGLDYRVAAVVQDTDVELPMFTNSGPLPFDDIRLTDFDVILSRGDVDISNPVARNFAARFSVPTAGGGSFEIIRGFAAVDATVGDRTYRFVNTHLEPDVQAVKDAQAAELIEELQGEIHPVIVVGDLNTPAPDGITYNTFLDAGYEDAWSNRIDNDAETGNTANHPDELRGDLIELHKRIDFILVRNADQSGRTVLGKVFATVVGDELADRTPSGLWPSDHAGVVAKMEIPEVN